MKKLFSGAITALVTPFKKDGSIDISSLKKLVDWQIDQGINGIVPCGSTGEAATINEKEYHLVVSTVVKQAGKRVPIIAGAGSNDSAKAITFSKLAKKAGADGLLHVTPYYNKPTPTGLVAHFKAIANAVDLPIILYNVPGRTGSNVLPNTILRVAKEVPQVIGVKEASGSIIQIMDIINGAPDYFCVLSGDDSLTFPLIALGGDGIISVASNEAPKAMADLCSEALAGNWDAARKLHFEWLDLMNINFIETNPQPVKCALTMMGKIKEVYRLPLVAMDEKNKEKLKAVLEKHKML